MQLNNSLGMTQQQRASYQNILNKKPMFKGASFGGNMNHKEIATRFREKRAALANQAGSILKNIVRPSL